MRADLYKIHQRAVALGAIADGLALPGLEIDRQRHRVERRHLTGAQADLHQPVARPGQHREGARGNLNVKRAVIARAYLVKGAGAIPDHAGEDIQPPGRAFGIGEGRDGLGQAQAFLKLGEIDASGFQHRSALKVELVHDHIIIEAIGDRALGARQEARAQSPGPARQTQIQARGLDLPRFQINAGTDPALSESVKKGAVRQNAGGEGHQIKIRLATESFQRRECPR